MMLAELRDMSRPPVDNPWMAGAWIAARNPWAEHLMRRVGAVDEDGFPDVDRLAEIIREAEAQDAAWVVYTNQHPEPRDEDAWERWRADGPEPTSEVREFGVMSSGERKVLRLLGVLGRGGACISAGVSSGLDERGQAISRAVLEYLIGPG